MAEQVYAGYNDVDEIVDDKSLLDGLGPTVVVEVFNPLSVPFRAKFARTIAAAPQLSDADRRVAEVGGIDVRKQGGANQHAISYVVLEPGKTMKLYGDIAQVVVRQMVTYIIQQRGKKSLIPDPTMRREVEQEIVVNYKSMIQNQTLTDEEQFNRQLDELNNPDSDDNIMSVTEEVAFPTEQNYGTTETVPQTLPSESRGNGQADFGGNPGTGVVKKPVGRPKTQKQASA